MTLCVYYVCEYICITDMALPSTLLIGYYFGVLLRDINADLLLDDMFSEGLLSSHDCNLVATGHSIYHRNYLLLDYVRQENTESLSVFTRVILKLWPEIGSQLNTGMYT